MKNVTRTYSMEKRAAKARGKEVEIMQAVRELWMEQALPEITLEQVADRAGVTVRTVLRKFGSKEGLLSASIQHAASEKMDREEVAPGDLEGGIEALMDEYEQMGDAVIRTIQLEKELPAAAEILKLGRKKHKAWCERVFEPYLPNSPKSAREEKLLALIAATEVYLWKLLRRDLKKGRAATQRVFLKMVNAIAKDQNQTI